MQLSNFRSSLISALVLLPLLSGGVALADTWVITDGPKRGTVLVTDGAGSTDVSWGLNQLFEANGWITWDEQGNYFFTGELGGHTRGGASGWGHVRRLGEDVAPVATFVEAVNSATNVVLGGRWGSECAPNGETALADLETARQQLDGILQLVNERVPSSRTRHDLRKKIDDMRRRIELAKQMLESSQSAPGLATELVKANSGKLRSKIRKLARQLVRYLSD